MPGSATDSTHPPPPPRLRRLARGLRAALSPRAVVLLYHRVADDPLDPHDLAVSPANFDEQMRALRDFGAVLSLTELERGVADRRLPRRAVAVTFDDGYADNLLAAKPILERHGIPATVFVTTGTIGRAREFWWDELQQLLLESGALPPAWRADVGGRAWRWELPPWPEDGSARPARLAIYREIHAFLMDLPHAPRLAVLDEFLAQSGRVATVRPGRRAMSDEEIAQLAAGGLIEVGAHTHTHPNLAAQPAAAQREEIAMSKRRLEGVLGRPVESFAYPFGLHTTETVDLVREAGFARACICAGHPVRYRSERYRLTRADLGNLGGDAFAAVLRRAVSW